VKINSRRLSVFVLIALLIVCATLSFYALSMSGTLGWVQVLSRGQVVDRGNYLVFLPKGINMQEKHPLVFALSPTADARSMIAKWSGVAAKHQWIVAASKDFHNDVSANIVFPAVEAELTDVETNYPVNLTRVIMTGLSGGAMGSHAMSAYYPDRVTAIVVNTGMINEIFYEDSSYPLGKWAVFLASPTDFRYEEMKRDRAFLDSKGWVTEWIEFTGGHALAPDEVYEQAAAWLEKNLP
jgi:predicted esterase